MADIVQLKEDGVAKYLKTHAAAIDGVDGNLVKATGNETVLGVKNFQDGAQSKGKSVLTQDGVKRLYINSTTNSSWNSGSATFLRYGDIVTVALNFQVRSSGDLGKDTNVIAESIVDDIYQPHEDFYFFVGTEANQAVLKFVGKAIKANSILTKSQWYVGTAVYLAKNKL
jgi:hypothetical protein